MPEHPRAEQQIESALDALEDIRALILKRIGAEGGNLKARYIAKLDLIGNTLSAMVPVQSMLSIIQQQAQLATHAIRNLSQAILPVRRELKGDNFNNDDNDVKGQ